MEKLTYKGYQIEIDQDCDADSPREWDNLGTMVCFHRNYLLGDKHKMSVEDVKAILDRKDVLALPLFLYDHNGITMSTKPFSCPWDSGQVGIIYVDYEKLKKEYSVKRITPKIIEKVRKVLIGEVEVYDQFLRGDVCCFTTKKDGETIYSCSGFYGFDECKKEAENIVEWHIKDTTKKHCEKLKGQIKNHVPLQYREPLSI